MTPLWALRRQPASFRGVPFAVEDNSLRRGRQVALHVYPFRDDPWPEDIGRSPRITSFRGFVVGDDCDSQIVALIAAAEAAGPGQLVHPTLGAFSAAVLEFSPCNGLKGRNWYFDMTVVPYVGRIFPAGVADTQAASQGLFGSFGAAVAKDFAAVQGAIGSVQQAVSGAVTTVGSYVGQAQGLMRDATSLMHLPAALSGSFGRFAGGGLSFNVPGLGGGITSIAQASAVANGAVASVTRIGSTLGGLAARL